MPTKDFTGPHFSEHDMSLMHGLVTFCFQIVFLSVADLFGFCASVFLHVCLVLVRSLLLFLLEFLMQLIGS